MKAVQFRFSLPRYGYTKIAGMITQREFYSSRSCVSFVDIPEPELRGPKWVKLRSVLSGFCGSDLGAITLHDSPTTQPFASFPFVLGHENYSLVEEVGSEVKGLAKGDRVIINPALGCAVRDIAPSCGPCSRGDSSICENFAEGAISPGTNTGFCRDTGGGWSKYYLAHESQVIKIPDSISDEEAVLIEPLCSALHPVMRANVEDEMHVLVMGCGVIGLGVIASLRGLGIGCHITGVDLVKKNREKALEKGADVVVDPSSESIFEKATDITGAKRYKPMLEKEICMGGFDRIFDCVGSTESINSSFRLAAGDALYVLIGIQTPKVIDWTPVWMKGLKILGNLGYGMNEYKGSIMHTFDIAIDLVKEKKVVMKDIITHIFKLDEYVKAIQVNLNKGRYGAIKTIFDLRDL